MSSDVGGRGPADLPGGGDNPAPESSKPVDQTAQPSGSAGHSDDSPASSANIPEPPQVQSVGVATTSASPHAETSPHSYSTELPGAPQDDSHGEAGAASTSTLPASDSISSPQWPLHAPMQDPPALTPEPPRIQVPASESQETIIRPPRREQTTTPLDKAVQTTPPLPYLNQPPRPAFSAADSQSTTHIRLQPDSSLSRYPGPHAPPQIRPTSQEGQPTSDFEVDFNPDARRSYSRRNQPLPPLPGRVTSYQGQRPSSPPIGTQYYHPTHQSSAGGIGQGMAGVGSFGSGMIGNVAGPSGRGGSTPLFPIAQGQEALPHMRDETRTTSVAPMSGTNTGHTTLDHSGSRTLKSTVDWLTPSTEEKQVRERTLGERLDPTLDVAKAEKAKCTSKAKIMGWSLNIAIGLQVVIGAMTTGLAAATTGRQTSITTAILGGFATIVASFLARARGSHEPELSVTRAKDLEQFIRECESFKMDFGLLRGSMYPGLDAKLEEFRMRFEELLGNVSGERRSGPPI